MNRQDNVISNQDKQQSLFHVKSGHYILEEQNVNSKTEKKKCND